MLTIGIKVDCGAGIAGDAPKPVSPGLDGPIAQEVNGKSVATAKRLSRRMWIPRREMLLDDVREK
jgi:hypothetical protein